MVPRNSSTHEVIKTIDVEEYPWVLGYNPDSNYVYVSNRHSNSVSIIDGTSNEILKTVKVGDSPFVIEYNPIKNAMYVSNQGSHSVSVIDGANNEVVDTIGDIYTPQDILFNPDNENLYVSGYAHNTISVIDGHTNEVIKEVGTVGSGPYNIEYDPQNKCIYIGNGNTADVTVLDTTTNEIVKRIDVGGIDGGPSFILDQVKYNPYNGYIYVSDGWRPHLSIIDGATNELIQEIDMAAGGGSVYNPTNHNMYTIGNGVAIIDSSTNEVLQTVNTPSGGISAIEYNPSDENIYTANDGAASISVISKSTPEPLIPKADSGPDQIVDSGDTVQLDGSGSSDPSGGTLTYKWTQTSGPEGTLSDSTSASLSFTATESNVQTDLTFQLVVTNEEGIESEPDSVTITVRPVPPPTANAGPDQIVNSGEIVQLDGSGSTDSVGGTLAYQWTQTEGTKVTMSDSTTVNPTFTAPNTNTEVDLVFELVVTNEKGVVSEPDSVTITVSPSNNPPPPFEGILDSGNNVNIQVQENSGNNVGGQSGFGGTYSDSPILQDQSTKQDSNVVS